MAAATRARESGMTHDRRNIAFHVRRIAAQLDDIQREIVAERIPALADIEDTRRRILALADRIEADR